MIRYSITHSTVTNTHCHFPSITEMRDSSIIDGEDHAGGVATSGFTPLLEHHSHSSPSRDSPSDGLLSESIHSNQTLQRKDAQKN